LTFGATISLRPDVQVNPAVYVENTRPHRVLGYVVLIWNFPLRH
jgi:hypothetical protein